MNAMKGGVAFVVVFVGLDTVAHFREPKWKPLDRSKIVLPPAPPSPPAPPRGPVEYDPIDRTEVPHSTPTDQRRAKGPEIDRVRIYAWASEHARTSDTDLMIITRAKFEMRRARIDTGEDGVLSEADMEFLARLYAESWVRYAKDYEHRDLTSGEIRGRFDEMMGQLRKENDEAIKQAAVDRKTQSALDSALGSKGDK